jgi:hypothetical protein
MTDLSKLLNLTKNKNKTLAMKSGRRQRTTTLKNGDTRIRVLPSWRKNLHGTGEEFVDLGHDFGMHYIKNAAGELVAVYICVAKTFGQSCPICEAIGQQLAHVHNDVTAKLLNDAKASGRVLINALVRNGDNPNEPVILEIPPSVFEKILARAEQYLTPEDGSEPVNIFDLQTGFDLIISRDGVGMNVKYDVTVARNSTRVDSTVMAKLHDLDNYVAQEYEEGKLKALAAVNGVGGALPAPTRPQIAPATNELGRPTSNTIFNESAYDEDVSFDAPTQGVAVKDDELDALLNELEGDRI